jgi:phage shock protein C
VSTASALHFEPSRDDRIVAGVCGGLAATLGVDATLVRLVFALLALAGGAGILLYLAVVPESVVPSGSPWRLELPSHQLQGGDPDVEVAR